MTIGQISPVVFFLFFAITPILGRVGRGIPSSYTDETVGLSVSRVGSAAQLKKVIITLATTFLVVLLTFNFIGSGFVAEASGGESWEISIPPLESSSRPASSGSTSLASSSENTEKDYLSPSSRFSSPSTSTSTDSSTNTEQKESLVFLSDEPRCAYFQEQIIRAVHERLADMDPQGKIARIPDGEIIDALRLDYSLRTQQEMEEIWKNVWEKPWPSYGEADRTSIYPRLWDLFEKNKRPDRIFDIDSMR